MTRTTMRPSAFNTIPARLMWPLRAFLGITFIYAGLQKFTDPGFLVPGSATYIGSQLQAFSHGSPIGFLFQWFAVPFPVLTGILTIATELAIGVLILLGLFTRPAALIGLLLNLIFFLSASWHVSPYFYGSDIVFVMCWMTLAMTGPGPLSLDAWRAGSLRQVPASQTSEAQVGLSRREALTGLAGTLVLLLLGLRPQGTAISNATVPNSPRQGRNGLAPLPSSGAVRVARAAQIPVNHALAATDPKTGDPAIIVHAPNSHFYAYDAVCTHAGCTVGYDPATKLITCPCHGAQFDPTHSAQVVAGPAPRPLASLPMSIDHQGNVYLYGAPGQPPHARRKVAGDDSNDNSDSGGGNN